MCSKGRGNSNVQRMVKAEQVGSDDRKGKPHSHAAELCSVVEPTRRDIAAVLHCSDIYLRPRSLVCSRFSRAATYPIRQLKQGNEDILLKMSSGEIVVARTIRRLHP